MDININANLMAVPIDPRGASKNIADNLLHGFYPLMIRIRNKLQKYSGCLSNEEISKLKDVYALCICQIKKCLQTLFDIFKTEHCESIFLQDSRQCTLERLSWCINRLLSIEKTLDESLKKNLENQNDSILVSPIYFVNWIDNTFDVLLKLSGLIYKTDYKDTESSYKQWKNELVECVISLHMSLDELLLSAMTLCKYCLPSDQHIVKARCQVVLRETKVLLNELIKEESDGSIKVTVENLKLPIMPSNVNVLIDVLKDVLYVLETNTNTALLALVVHCFSYNQASVDVLKEHFYNANGTCSCHMKNDSDDTEDCSFVKDFDLYNERLMQIGSFAVSCSSDQNRILILRSGLASLEALDPHLVPALMLSPESHHANLLVNTWRQEVQEIRDSIFLIIDPAAFAEKTKQMMHQFILDLSKEISYNNSVVCAVINIGCVVLDFFSVYNNLEPDALVHHEKLVPLLADLNKVQKECKVVSDLLSSGDDFIYDKKKTRNNKKVSFEQLLKRLKLLYTLVGRINTLLHPKDNDELFECEPEEEIPKNITRILHKNKNTYVLSPRKPMNVSRSMFARTTNIRSSTTKFPLQKLTKHLNLRTKNSDALSFSLQLDEIFNLSEVKGGRTEDSNRTESAKIFTKQMESVVRESSVLYNYSPKKRSSLRKAVLNRRHKMPFDSEVFEKKVEISQSSAEKGNLIDEVTSLQITDILNEMSDMTTTFSQSAKQTQNATYSHKNDKMRPSSSNILKIDINTNANTTMGLSKQIWNIPVHFSTIEMPLDNSSNISESNVTLPSNVTTLDRITDIEFVESKLKNLKGLDLETSL